MAQFSIRCVKVDASSTGSTVTVEQRNLAADLEPIRTFTVVVPLGATTAAIVAAARAEVAAWYAAQAAAAAAVTTATAEATRLQPLVGAATTVTVP